MRELAVMALVMATPSSSDWLAIHLAGQHGPTLTVHHQASGVLIHVARGRPYHEPWLSESAQSRVIRQGSIPPESDEIHYAELGDPRQEMRLFEQEIGQTPAVGSRAEALFLAYRPTETCLSTLKYRVREPDGFAAYVSATVCSPEQRKAIDSFVRLRLWEQLEPRIDNTESRAIDDVTHAQLSKVRKGAPLAEVLRYLGQPFSVWPRYPDGLALEYWAHSSTGAQSLIVELERDHTVVQARFLAEDRWIN